ncbi:MAG: hypothetical protein Q9180_003919, partial [Flavoplaca navasiana]
MINSLTDILAEGASLSLRLAGALAKCRWEERSEEQVRTSEVEKLSLGGNVNSLEVPGPSQSI